MVAFGETGDKRVYFYSTDGNTNLGYYGGRGKQPISLKFNEDAAELFVGFDDGVIKVIDTSTQSAIRTINTDHSKVFEIDFNEDYSRMLTCGDNKKFKVWNTATESPIYTSPDHGDPVFSCKFAYDSSVVMVAGKKSYLYQPSSGNSYQSPTTMDFSENVYSVDIRKGTYEYVVGFDKGIAVSPSTSRIAD